MFVEENRIFEERRMALFADHPRKWALVKAPGFLEVFATMDDAFKAGLDRFGIHGGFMIKQILEQDEIHFIPSCWTVD